MARKVEQVRGVGATPAQPSTQCLVPELVALAVAGAEGVDDAAFGGVDADRGGGVHRQHPSAEVEGVGGEVVPARRRVDGRCPRAAREGDIGGGGYVVVQSVPSQCGRQAQGRRGCGRGYGDQAVVGEFAVGAAIDPSSEGLDRSGVAQPVRACLVIPAAVACAKVNVSSSSASAAAFLVAPGMSIPPSAGTSVYTRWFVLTFVPTIESALDVRTLARPRSLPDVRGGRPRSRQ